MNDASLVLLLVSRLIGLSLLLQTLEFFKIKESFSENGIWKWSEVKKEYYYLPQCLKKFLDWIMKDKYFLDMLSLRFLLSFLLIIFPYWPFFQFLFLSILFSSTFLITIRFRGSFNGGSDYLSLILLLCLSVGFIHPILAKAALWYITLQVISSYFLAGLIKIKEQKWRDGTALKGFISSPSYQAPLRLIFYTQDQKVSKILGFSVIFFELSFPLVLTHPNITIFYLVAGALFHFSNFLIFGLNRFFFVWCASYPAIHYCAQLI